MIDVQYINDKIKEQETARDEHVQKMLMELIDQLCRDFNCEDREGVCDRDDIINIIEKFVTKRRRWL